MNIPEFCELVKCNDIFVMTETKLEDCYIPNIEFDDFKVLFKNRKTYKHKSGGVAGYIKNCIAENTKDIENSHDNSLWIQFVLGFQFLLAIVYIPTENSLILVQIYLIILKKISEVLVSLLLPLAATKFQ